MKYFTLVFILFITKLSFAQKGTWQLGVNNGLNNSFYYIKPIPFEGFDEFDLNMPSARTSYRFGIIAKYEVIKNCNIGLEVNYEQKGWILNKAYLLDDNTRNDIGVGKVELIFPYYSFPMYFNYALPIKKYKLLAESGYVLNIRQKFMGDVKTSIPNSIFPSFPEDVSPRNMSLKNQGYFLGGGFSFIVYKNINCSLIYRFEKSTTGAVAPDDFTKHLTHSTIFQITYHLKKANSDKNKP